MIFHLSIAAAQPKRVADVLAELWNGEVFPFPPVANGSFAVLAGDERSSLIEIYPLGTELIPAEGDADATSRHNPQATGLSATHAAVASSLSTGEVMAIAEREGWLAKVCRRGGMFGVIELWLENNSMIEVLTEDMAAEYRATMTVEGWRAALAAGAPA
jgi:hypothetical protein